MTDVPNQTDTSDVLLRVYRERIRQLTLKAEGRFAYTPSDPEVTWPQRLAMLTEELGEVAREILALEGIVQEQPSVGKLRKELVQLAAVAVACVEATLPGPHPTPPTYEHYHCDFCDYVTISRDALRIHAAAHARDADDYRDRFGAH